MSRRRNTLMVVAAVLSLVLAHRDWVRADPGRADDPSRAASESAAHPAADVVLSAGIAFPSTPRLERLLPRQDDRFFAEIAVEEASAASPRRAPLGTRRLPHGN